MLGTILGLGLKFFGPTAFKAVVGGLASGGTVLATTAAGACDFTTIGSQLGAALGAYVVGHLATWIVPNKPAKA